MNDVPISYEVGCLNGSFIRYSTGWQKGDINHLSGPSESASSQLFLVAVIWSLMVGGGGKPGKKKR